MDATFVAIRRPKVPSLETLLTLHFSVTKLEIFRESPIGYCVFSTNVKILARPVLAAFLGYEFRYNKIMMIQNLIRRRALLLVGCVMSLILAATAVAGRITDEFEIKKINGNEAIVQGEPREVKAGDDLYFPLPPYRFRVTAVNGNELKVALPPSHSLTPGRYLLRKPNEIIKKYIDTESKLKTAFED